MRHTTFVMISSTSRDLPEHRNEVMRACLQQEMFPVMMENLPASDNDAIRASLQMVEDADIYLGVFAHRYGYVPDGHDISITEMEYNHAVKLNKPRLIFVMHDDHPVRARDVETGPGAVKLAALKDRLLKARVVNFFRSPADLRGQVFHSLSQWAVPNDEKSSLAPKIEHKRKDIIITEEDPKGQTLSGPHLEFKERPKIGRDDEVDLFLELFEFPLVTEIKRLAHSRKRGGYTSRNEIWNETKTSLFEGRPREFALRVIDRMVNKRLLIDHGGSIEPHPRAYTYS